jgi:hypothetical protein
VFKQKVIALFIQSKWLLWIPLNMIGFSFVSIFLVIGAFLTALYGDVRGVGGILWYFDATILGIISGGLAGVFLGVAQWGIVYGEIPRAWRWIVMTIIGCAIGNTFFTIAIVPLHPEKVVAFVPVIYWVLSVIFGGFIGLAQWTILRRYFYKTVNWIWASSCAWTLSIMVFLLLIGPIAGQDRQIIAITGAIVGVLYSVITGLSLAQILKSPRCLKVI